MYGFFFTSYVVFQKVHYTCKFHWHVLPIHVRIHTGNICLGLLKIKLSRRKQRILADGRNRHEYHDSSILLGVHDPFPNISIFIYRIFLGIFIKKYQNSDLCPITKWACTNWVFEWPKFSERCYRFLVEALLALPASNLNALI